MPPNSQPANPTHGGTAASQPLAAMLKKKKKMTHKSEVENYAGSMEELVEEIGNLKYDSLANFLDLLADKIHRDGKKDQERNRVKLANNLFQSAERIRESKEFIDNAWMICEPFTH